jgi:protein-S-isoprenylcysteine O-methyltransferase Ste14
MIACPRGGRPAAALLFLLLLTACQTVPPPERADARPQQRLVTSGVFAHLRNPLRQGWWMLQAGWGVALGTPAGLLLVLALGTVLDFWVKWEELTLAAKLGGEYVAYRARTPRWGWQR